jgi:hypothetical protein
LIAGYGIGWIYAFGSIFLFQIIKADSLFFRSFVGGGHQDGGQEADERHRHGGQGQARGQSWNSFSIVIQN